MIIFWHGIGCSFSPPALILLIRDATLIAATVVTADKASFTNRASSGGKLGTLVKY
jgi:hypothetical protein